MIPSVSSIIKANTIEGCAYKRRFPIHVLEQEAAQYPDDTYDVLTEFAASGKHGLSYTQEITMMGHIPKHCIPHSEDLICKIELAESEWNGLLEYKKNPIKSDFYLEMLLEMEDKLDCHCGLFMDVITSYLDTLEITIPYLCLAYRWLEKFGDDLGLDMLDLILEYAYGIDILRLMKVPSYTIFKSIGTDYNFKPIFEVGMNLFDMTTLSPEESIPIVALPYNNFEVSVFPLVKENNRYRRQHPPNIFFSTCAIVTYAFVDLTIRGRLMSEPSIVPSLGLLCNGGCSRDINWRNPRMDDEYAKTVLEDDFSDAVCKICLRDSAVCSECGIRDVLFCDKHSSVVRLRKYEQILCLCYICEDGKLLSVCMGGKSDNDIQNEAWGPLDGGRCFKV
jgi:hypothetical protein